MNRITISVNHHGHPCPESVATEMKPPAVLRINRKILILIFTRYDLA